MKKIIFAAALLTIGATAHAGTYNVEGVTVHVQDGCRSSSCVSVYAPGYGYYHEGHSLKVHKTQKDTARIASSAKEDKTTPAVPATAPVTEATPAKTPEAAPQATPSDSTPAK
jgi:hypothetical protein